jgi:hypothetical protein
MKNKLAYLGFFGLVGFGGIFFEGGTLFSFFAFFSFFSFANVIPDELFLENVKQSALRAFFAQLTISSTALAIGSMMMDYSLSAWVMVIGLSLTYAVGILVFAFSIIHYEYIERKGKSD